MHIVLYVVAVVIALFVVFFIWGVVRLRKGGTQANEAIRKVHIEDLPGLIAEGKAGLAKAYGVTIDFNDPEAAAKMLDELFANEMKLKNTFQKDGFYWYFVLPVGALVGEFIRVNAKGVWKENPDGLSMEVPVKDGAATCHPFDKVLKQIEQGEKGDLYAYLLSSIQLASGKAVA
jgi:hypothetical protein